MVCLRAKARKQETHGWFHGRFDDSVYRLFYWVFYVVIASEVKTEQSNLNIKYP